MKRIKRFNESKSQLEIGTEVESEHESLYNSIDNYLESFNIQMPFDKKEFFRRIAETHLKEDPNYYTKLKKMENE